MLLAKTGFVKIIAPLQEGLGLFADRPFPHAVAVCTHGRGLDGRIGDRIVRTIDVVRPPDLTFRTKVATGAGQPSGLGSFRPRLRFGHLRNVYIGDGERFREVADIARFSCFLGLTGMDGELIDTGKGMGCRRGRNIGR